MSKKALIKGIAENALPLPPQKPVKVFGSYIWPEMRTVCGILDVGKRTYRVEKTDIFTEKGQKEEAMGNPARVQPLVIINE